MKVRSIRLTNFRRHRDTHVELPDGVTGLLGANGSGKSSLLEGIAFALFGADAIRTAKPLLRHDGAAPSDSVRAELEAEVGGQALRVVRELRGRDLKPVASLECDGVVLVPPGAGSAEAVTAEVERRLGMDADAFFTTVVARQKELARLADERPAARKRLLLRMLGIDQLDAALAAGRQRRVEADARLHALRSLLVDPAALDAECQAADAAAAAAQAALDASDAAVAAARARAQAASIRLEAEEHAARLRQEEVAAERRLAAEDAWLAQAVAAAEQEARKAEAAATDAEALAPVAAGLARLEEQLAAARRAAQQARFAQDVGAEVRRLEAALAALPPPPALPPLPDARAAEAAARDRLAAAKSASAHSQAALRQAADHVAHLGKLGDAADCPACERPLAGHLDSVLSRAKAQQAEREAALRSDQALLAQAEAAHKASAHALAELERAVRQQEERSRQAGALSSRLDHERELLASLSISGPPLAPDGLARLEQAERQARRAHEARLRLAAVAEGLAGARIALAGHTQRLGQVRAGHGAALARVQAHAAADALWLQARAEGAAARQEEAKAEAARHHARTALELERRDVAQARRRLAEEQARRVQERALEEEARLWAAVAGAQGGGLLDRFRDHLVQRVGPAVGAEAGRLLALFSGGRYTEVLLDDDHEVYVTEGGRPCTLDRFSGGEQDIVHLALRLAVSRLLAERSGAEVRFLALDEVFGSLDADRRAHVLQALQGLGGVYGQVLVVSHLEGLADSLDQCLVVRDDGGAAAVTLHKG